MYSPNRLANTYTREQLSRLFQTSSNSIYDHHLKKQYHEINQQILLNLSDSKCNNLSFKEHFEKEAYLSIHEKILKKGRNYANKILNLDEKKKKKEEKKSKENEERMKRIEEIKNEEYEHLNQNITKLKQKFLSDAKRLQRNALIQVDKLKEDMMQSISKIEENNEKIIEHKSKELIDSVFRKNDFELRKSINFNTNNSRFFSLSSISFNENRKQSSLSFAKVAESRQKIQKIKEKFQNHLDQQLNSEA